MYKSHSKERQIIDSSKNKDKSNGRRKFKTKYFLKLLSVITTVLLVSALLTGQVTFALPAKANLTAEATAAAAVQEPALLPVISGETTAALFANSGQKTLASLPVKALSEDVSASNSSSAVSAANSGKTEVVYAVLDANGKAGDIHVVNHFELAERGEITDYGDYDEIIWLTGNQPAQNSNVIKVSAEQGNYYYEGVLKSAELPWDFSLDWFLDGRQVDPGTLSGAEGRLKIVLTCDPSGSADEIFIDNYILQIGFSLPRDVTTEIFAEDATIAEAGNNTLVTFVTLDGDSSSFELSAQIKDFYMPAISISAVKMNLGFDIPDDLELDGEMSQLVDAISELKEGTDKLSDAAGDLSEGMDDIVEGAGTLATEGDKLTSGIGEAAEGTDKYVKGVSSYLDGVSDYVAGIKTYTNGVGDLADGTAQLDLGVAALASGLDELSGQNEQLMLGSEQIAGALQAISSGLGGGSFITNSTEENQAQLDQLLFGSAAINSGLNSFLAAFAGDGTAANPGLIAGLEEVSAGLGGIKGQLDNSIGTKVDVPAKPVGLDGWAAYLNSQAPAGVTVDFGAYLNPATPETSVLVGVLDGQMDALIAAAKKGNAAVDSLNELSAGIGGLKAGQDQIIAGLKLAVFGTEAQPGLKTLVENYAAIDAGINELISQIKNLSANMGSLPELISGLQQLSEQYDLFHQGLEQYTSAVSQLAGGVSSTDPNQPGLQSGFSRIAEGLGELKSGGKDLRKGGDKLVSGSTELTDGGTGLSSGLSELKDGVREYINGVKDLSSGLREYQDGLIAYTDGVNELAEGVNEFEAETQDIDQQLLDEIDKKIDEYLNKDFVPESFVSAQNVNVESVQFVFTTEEIPKPKAAVIEVPKEENGNFWDRVAGLFGG